MKALTGNNLDTIEKHEMGMLTEKEVEEVSGGILCLGILAFGLGYAIGTGIYEGGTWAYDKLSRML